MARNLVIFAFLCAQGAMASLEVGNPVSQSLNAKTPLIIDGIYQSPDIKEGSRVLINAAVSNYKRYNNPGDLHLTLDPKEQVAVQSIGNGEVLMTIVVPFENKGQTDQFIISEKALVEAGLTFVSPGDADYLQQIESGYETVEVAKDGGHVRSRPRQHQFYSPTQPTAPWSFFGQAQPAQPTRQGKIRGTYYAGAVDSNGRAAGGGRNCVFVVKSKTGAWDCTGGRSGLMSCLVRRHGYHPVHKGSISHGAVCIWNGPHVAWFDGQCFQPTYPRSPCGKVGNRGGIAYCVAP